MKEVRRVFPTGNECELSVENVHGKIRVTGWDRPLVEVTAVKERNDNTKVEIAGDGKRVWVRTRAKSEANDLGRPEKNREGSEYERMRKALGDVEYTIHVPENSEVSLKAVNGSIHASELIGSVYAKTVNGGISLTKITGSVVGKTTNGSISGENIKGQASLTSVSGRIAIRDSQLPSLTAKAVSGSISAETSLDAAGRYHAKSISGNFDLIVPDGTECTVTANGPNGKVVCELPYEEVNHGPGQSRIMIGEGSAEVEFSTISGSVHIRQRDGKIMRDEKEEGRPRQEPSPQSPEMTILRAIERGELSVDDALDRLDEL